MPEGCIVDKVDVYLRAWSAWVIVVDPRQRVVELLDIEKTALVDQSGAIEHPAFARVLVSSA